MFSTLSDKLEFVIITNIVFWQIQLAFLKGEIC